MAGDYARLFDLASLSSYRPGFVTANGGTAASAEAALAFGLMAGGRRLPASRSVPRCSPRFPDGLV